MSQVEYYIISKYKGGAGVYKENGFAPSSLFSILNLLCSLYSLQTYLNKQPVGIKLIPHFISLLLIQLLTGIILSLYEFCPHSPTLPHHPN